MAHKKKCKDRFEPEELKKLLHSYWLVADYGLVDEGIRQVAKACSEAQRVKVALQKRARAEPIMNTLEALGIHYGYEVVNDRWELLEYKHASRRRSNRVCILQVPALADRIEDFGLLLPFAFDLALQHLNEDRGPQIERIEGGFILSVLVLLRFGRCGLLEIMQDAIGCAEDGVV